MEVNRLPTTCSFLSNSSVSLRSPWQWPCPTSPDHASRINLVRNRLRQQAVNPRETTRSLARPVPYRVSSREHSGKSRGNLLSPLHLIAKDAFDDFRISAAPSPEQGIVDRKRIFDDCEFLVFLIQSVVRGRTEIKL